MRPIYILGGALIVIAALVLVFVSIFKPGKNDKPATPTVVLVDHASKDNSVSYTLDGKTTASENHRAVKITTSKNSRVFEIIGGYQGQVILSKTYGNDEASYRVFLAGLQTYGFLKTNNNNSSLVYEGSCPLGYRYIFTITGIKDAPELLWTTNCGKNTGNFGGSLSNIQRLFKNQIPDYQKLVSGLKI